MRNFKITEVILRNPGILKFDLLYGGYRYHPMFTQKKCAEIGKIV